MPRIPYFDLADASPAFRDLVAARPPLNVYRMVANGGATGDGFIALGSAILRHSTLDPVLRELVILRVGALCESPYEVFQHRRVAAQAGVPGNKIDAVLERPQGDPVEGVFSDLEFSVLRYADAVVRQVKAPAPLFDAVAAALSPQQLIELTMTIGFYMLVSRLLENFEVEVEDPPVH